MKKQARKIWLTTDTHFSHEAVKEYCGRPDNYEQLIFDGLSRIEENDVLIHLGDICMGKDKEVHEKYIIPLKCKKFLVRGNHDGKSDNWYLDNGWTFVCRHFGIKIYGIRILFSHKPMADDGWYDINIHGHFHNSDHRTHEPEMIAIKNDKQKLLAIEYTNYEPVLLKDFITN